MTMAETIGNAPALIAVCRLDDATVVDVNHAFEEVLGYSRSEILGITLGELNLWPNDRDYQRLVERLVERGRLEGETLEFATRAGHEFRGSLSAEIFKIDGQSFWLLLVEDIAPQQQWADALRRAEERYRSIFVNAMEGIYQTLPDGQFLDANPSLARILGYDSPQQLITEVTDIATQLYVDPAARAAFLRRLESEGHVEALESEVWRRDGSRIRVSENMRAIRDGNGRLAGVEGTMVDITDRRRAEQALQQSEERYRTLVDHSQDGVFVSHKGEYRFVNQTYADMLGYSPDDMIGQPFMNFIAPEDRALTERLWEQRRAGHWETDAYEIHLLQRDGERLLASVRAGPIQFEGELASIGTVRDITEERRKEQALAEVEARYREIFEQSVVGIYQSTPEGHFIAANQAMADIFGYASPRELIESLPNIRELYAQPAERARYLADLNEQGTISGLEFRIRRRDGETRWVSQSSRVVRDAEGRIQYYEGTLQDIQARKDAEAARYKSEELYRTLVEHSQVGVFINEGGHYTYVNRAFAEMLGYTEDELTGAHYSAVFAPEEVAAADERFHRRLRGEPVDNNYESELLHKDGKTRVVVTQSIGVIEAGGKRLMTGTVRDITAQKRVERQLRHNATHDPLTGLPNRTLFVARLRRAIERTHQTGNADWAVLFLDLDGFKVINDSLGHATGDEMLVELGRRLERCLRPQDTIARHGGDEFTVLMEGIAGMGEVVDLAERMLGELRGMLRLGEHEVFTSASIGIAPGETYYTSTDEPLRDADIAMYRAKAAGKSGHVIFDTQMHAVAKARLELETDLRLALEREEFRVYYQPIVDLASDSLIGFEALLRWQHPRWGLIGPGRFLRIAEETGLILPLGWWVLDVVCRQLNEWRRSLDSVGELGVSINISDIQFAHHSLPDRVAAKLAEYNVPPRCLRLEITERVFMDNPGQAETVVERLRHLGTPLYVDDFGTGYSSLSYLRDLPFDTLKIDRSFIVDIHRNDSHLSIVRTIVQLARDLGMHIVAEGIELAGQAEALRAIGCPQAQGNFFSGAVDAETATGLLATGINLETRD